MHQIIPFPLGHLRLEAERSTSLKTPLFGAIISARKEKEREKKMLSCKMYARERMENYLKKLHAFQIYHWLSSLSNFGHL